jgi:hypothetical protein
MSRRAAHLLAATAAAALLLSAAVASSAHSAWRTGAPSLSRTSAGTAARAFKLPPVRHVFVIVLENEGYASTFGAPTTDPYLAQTLPAQGALLENYYATGHASNDNYISLVSGQPPNAQNQADCPEFDNFTGALMLESGVEAGSGCVYPAEVPNIGTQLSAVKRSWKAYMGDMGNDPNRETAVCGHPALESSDGTQKAEAGDGYATRHNPFVYFHSVIDEAKFCDKHVVALGGPHGEMPAAALHGETGLATDLSAASKTPKLSFITPNLCEDGHDYPCTNQPSGTSALGDIDTFLETWVPKITSSPAYQRNGLLEIIFDEAASSEAQSCCQEMPGPGSPLPGVVGPGGGRVGAVLLSPFIKPGTVSAVEYNHYSSLASWETLLGVAKLADAKTVTSSFGADVFTAPGA